MFHVNQPPFGGSCETDRTSGVTLTDKFGFRCSEWEDPEDIGINKYKVTGARKTMDIHFHVQEEIAVSSSKNYNQ